MTNVFYNDINLKELEARKKALDGKRPLPKHTLASLIRDMELKWTYNSNAIEGNTLTLSETKVVLEDGMTIGGKTLREHFEVIGHKEALDYMKTLVRDRTELSEYQIRGLHNLILKNIDADNAGKYRSENVMISGARHKPPIFTAVPALMEELVRTNNALWQKEHPVVRACFLHGEFVKIHPFADGNGRTARLLMNLELMKAGYLPAIIRNESKSTYYDALDKGAVSGDYTDFVNLAAEYEREQLDYVLSLTAGNSPI